MITVRLKGRLGNHLFQYAICRITADRLGTTYRIPSDWLGKNIFNCSLGNETGNKKTKHLFREGENAYNPDVFKVSNNTYLEGYFQSEKYLWGYEEEIKKWFHLEKPDFNYLDDKTCVIHFRCRDAYSKPEYKLNSSYFERAKKIVKDKFGDKIRFVILTDNPKEAKKYFPNDRILKNNEKLDLQYIMYSKYKIISHSTFSWWPSWLNLNNSNIVIAPNRWMNYNYARSNSEIFYPADIKTEGFTYIN